MGTGKTYSTKYLLDSNNSSGAAGQVLISTSTGIDWVDANTVPGIIGGPFLPLTAGSTVPLTGDLYLESSSTDVVMSGNGSGAFTIDNTTGQIAFKANGSTVQSMIITSSQISLNEAVSINSTSLSSPNKLQVNGQTRVIGQFMVGDSSASNTAARPIHVKQSGAATIRLEDSDNDNLAFDLIVDEGTGFKIAETIGGDSGDDTRLTIHETSGNVSIGSTTEEGRLLVQDSGLGNTDGDFVTNLVLMGSRWDLLFKQIRTADETDWKNTTVRIQARVDSTNMQSIDFATDNSYNRHIDINTGSNNFNTRFTAGGSVGIGTVSPDAKLHIVGSQRIQGDTGSLTFLRTDNITQIGKIYDDSGFTIEGKSNNNLILRTKANTLGEGIKFQDSSSSNLMFIDGTNGNVGIGTTSPANKLVVSVSTAGDYAALINNTNSTNGYGLLARTASTGTSSYAFAARADSSDIFVVRADGNVGIGTTSPSRTLHVSTDSGVLIKGASGSTNAKISLLPASGGRQYDLGNVGSDFRIFDASASVTRMYFDNDGNTGIGTTSPDTKLEVRTDSGAASANSYFRVTAGAAGAYGGTAHFEGAYNDYGNVNQPNIVGKIDMASEVVTTTDVGGTMKFFTKATGGTYATAPIERMRITSAGNVGIGTTSPTSKLFITAADGEMVDTYMVNILNQELTAGDNFGVQIRAGLNTSDVSLNVANKDGSSLFRVRGDGNVGIGTTNPGNKLSIQGSQATVYNSTDSGGQAFAGTTINNTNTAGNTNNFSQLLFTIGTNNNSVSRIVAIRSGSDASDLAFVGESTAGVAEYMRIKSGGNVGIGINNPSALLEVRKGSISGQIAKFSAINPHVVIESSTAGNAVLHLKPNATSSKSGQFKVTAGNGYNFRWSNDASGTAETAYMDLDTSTTGGGDLTVKGDVIAYGSPSDKKYKENIKPIESALDKAMQLQGVTFDWKDSESILEIKEDIGFIAQDVQEVLPELVRDNGKGNLSLRYQGITPILLEAIKELKAEIEELKLNNCNCNK